MYRSYNSIPQSRWIKCVMRNSGIDVDTHTSHSTRSAISSKVKQSGLLLNGIMKVAGGSNADTFSRFPDKPFEMIDADSFQRAALQ